MSNDTHDGVDLTAWPRTTPDARRLRAYYVARARAALADEERASERGVAVDATPQETRMWRAAIDRMLSLFSVAYLLRDATDEQAAELWLCIETGDIIPELLWDWAKDLGLDTEEAS